MEAIASNRLRGWGAASLQVVVGLIFRTLIQIRRVSEALLCR